jgi:hypothetical protein
MTDERLDKLGRYFTYHDLHKKYGISFEDFIRWVNLGVWHYWTSK